MASASTYEYTISVQDRVSSVMQKITGASTGVIDKLKSLDSTKKILQATTHDLQGSIYNLKQKMDLLQQEKELINPANMDVLREYNREIDSLQKQIDKFDNAGRGKKVNPFSMLNISAVMQQMQAVGEAFSGLAVSGIGFEQSMADLSSITGIAGSDLDNLADVARRTGRQSGLGAKQAADAFAILASQIQVDKIGMEGLEVLQRKTITLSQAAGMSMNDAAIALAGTINQFGLQATEADRVINVLAAGSKYGAAEIVDLSQSFKVVGAAANAAGLSVEATAGAVEVLSKNNLKGAEAGTALRNIVLKMQTVLGVDFSKNSLADALDALKPRMKDATYLSKIFGMENIAAAQFLIANSNAVSEMTAQVTGTNVAQEQAAIRTGTTRAMMERCNATIDNLKIGLFDLTGSFGGYATIVAQQLIPISQLIPLFKVMGGVTKLWGLSQQFLNLALWTSPITWIVVGVGVLVGAIVWAWQKFEAFRQVVLGTWEVMKLFGNLLFDSILGTVKNLIGGLGSLGTAIWKLFSGDFKGAAADAADGAKKLFASNPIVASVKLGTDLGNADWAGAWKKGKQAGSESWQASQKAKSEAPPSKYPVASIQSTATGAESYEQIMGALGGQGRSTSGSSIGVDLSSEAAANHKGSTAYSAIASKLMPVRLPSLAAMTAAAALPIAMATAPISAATSLATPSVANYTPTGESMPGGAQNGFAMNGGQGAQSLNMDHFCEIVIHVQRGDQVDAEQIANQVMDELRKTISNGA